MSQENVERLREIVEAFRAGTSESDREAMITKIAELYDPDIELDTSEGSVLDVSGVYRGAGAASSSGESGSPPGTPPNSSTSWSMPGTALFSCSTCGCAVAPRASRCPSGR